MPDYQQLLAYISYSSNSVAPGGVFDVRVSYTRWRGAPAFACQIGVRTPPHCYTTTLEVGASVHHHTYVTHSLQTVFYEWQ